MAKQTEITITTPFRVELERKKVKNKKIPISMNSYGNVNTFINNEVKSKFKDIVAKQIEGIKIQTPVEIYYKVFKPSKRKLDKMNVIAVTSKYLLDAITELGCWEDDNDDHVKTEVLLPTEYDKDNGRVEVTIKAI